MRTAEEILEDIEAKADGHDDGHLYSIGSAPFVAWDGDFEYYADQSGQEPLTREAALALLRASL
jgi:hypothetical protein